MLTMPEEHRLGKFLDITMQACLYYFKDTVMQPLCTLEMKKEFHWLAWSANILNPLQSILFVPGPALSPEKDKRVGQLIKILP